MVQWTHTEQENTAFTSGSHGLIEDYAVVFETLDQLQAAVVDDRRQVSAGLLLHKLADYTCHHLTAEEAVLSAAGFPGMAEREAEDRDVTRQVADYIARYELGEISIDVDFLDALRNWLRAHIDATDRAIGPWIARQRQS
jgi:hemerythrin-like metal-binding protein